MKILRCSTHRDSPLLAIYWYACWCLNETCKCSRLYGNQYWKNRYDFKIVLFPFCKPRRGKESFFLSLTIFLFSICILPGVNRIGKPPWKIVVQNHLMHLNYHHMYILSSMCTYLYLCSSCFWDLLTTWYVHRDVSLWNDMFLLTYTYAEKDNLFVSDINHKFEYLYH